MTMVQRKFTNEQVLMVRRMRRAGYTHREIMQELGISMSGQTLHSIALGRCYPELPEILTKEENFAIGVKNKRNAFHKGGGHVSSKPRGRVPKHLLPRYDYLVYHTPKLTHIEALEVLFYETKNKTRIYNSGRMAKELSKCGLTVNYLTIFNFLKPSTAPCLRATPPAQRNAFKSSSFAEFLQDDLLTYMQEDAQPVHSK